MAWTAAQQAAIDAATARLEQEEETSSNFSDEQKAILERVQQRMSAPQRNEDDGFVRTAVGDTAAGFISSVPKAAGAIVSLGSAIPYVNEVADPVAQGLNTAGEWLDDKLLSDTQKALNAELQQRLKQAAGELGPDASMSDYLDAMVAQGGEAASFMVENPGQVIQFISTSLPYVLGGGVVGAGAKGLGASSKAAAAIGEGLVAGGAVESEIVKKQMQEGEEGWNTNRLAALPAGVVTGLISRGGAALSPVDIDVAATKVLSGEATDLLQEAGKESLKQGLMKQTAKGTLIEGGEETLQSGQEKMFTNIGTDEPVLKDVGGEAVIGGITGAGQGAGVNVMSRGLQKSQESESPVDTSVSELVETSQLEMPDMPDGVQVELPEITAEGAAAGPFVIVNGQQTDITKLRSLRDQLMARYDEATGEEKAYIDQINDQVNVLDEQIAAREIEAGQKAEEVLNLRVKHAETFPDRKEYEKERKSQAEAAREADLDNPETELGAQFVEWRKTTNNYDTANNSKEAKKQFLAEEVGQIEDVDYTQDYLAELDDHARMKEVQANRNPQSQERIQREIAGVVQEYNAAVKEGNPELIAAVETKAQQFDPAEWAEAMRANKQGLKPLKKPKEAKKKDDEPVEVPKVNTTEQVELNQVDNVKDPVTTPKSKSPVKDELRNYAAEQLGEDWEASGNYDGLAQYAGGVNFTRKTKDKSNYVFKTMVDKIVAEQESENQLAVAEEAGKLVATNQVEENLIAGANELLGEGWETQFPNVAEAISKKMYANAAREIQAAANDKEKDDARGGAEQASKSALQTDKLKASSKNSEVRTAVVELFKRMVEEGTVDEYTTTTKRGGKNTLTLQVSKIAKELGFVNKKGEAKRQSVSKQIKELQPILARLISEKTNAAVNTTEDVKEALRSSRITGVEESAETNIGMSPAEQQSVVDNNEVFGSDRLGPSMSIIKSAGGSQSAVGQADEADTANALTKPDPIQEKRREEAKRRYESENEALLDLMGADAIEQWASMRSDGSVDASSLSKADAIEWVRTYAAYVLGQEGNKDGISLEELDQTQREIERRYDGTEKVNEGQETEVKELAQKPPEDAEGNAESGNAVESIGQDTTESEVATEERTEAEQAELDALMSEYNEDGTLKNEDKGVEVTNQDLAEQQWEENVVEEYDENLDENAYEYNQPKFSVKNLFGGKGKKSVTRTAFMRELADITGKKSPWRVTVFGTIAEAIAARITDEDIGTIRPQGWVVPDKNGLDRAYFILENIKEGNERAVIMHEIGSHMGLDNLLTEEQVDVAVDKIMEWSELDDGSDASLYAKAARVRAAEAAPHMENPETDYPSELIAYFIEEAVNDGVDVTKSDGTALGDFIRKMWAAFKSAYRKFRGDNVDALTPQDFVNLAYGAARLENSTTFHGTAAWFRKFNHDFMGTGEGAQAFGWGTYLAERFGIGNEYREADVKRKTNKLSNFPKIFEALKGFAVTGVKRGQTPKKVYMDMWDPETGGTKLKEYQVPANAVIEVEDGQVLVKVKKRWGMTNGWPIEYIVDENNKPVISNEDALKEFGQNSYDDVGQLYRVDYAFADDEMLDWDERVEDQPLVLEAINNMPEDIVDALMEDLATDEEFTGVTGELLYFSLSNLQFKDYMLEEYVSEKDYDQAQAAGSRAGSVTKGQGVASKAIASAFLYQYGIKGIKFLDNTSRKKARRVVDDSQDTLVNDVPQLLDIVNDSTPYLKEKGARVLYYKKADGTVESLLVSTKSAVNYRTTSGGEARPVRIASSVDGVSIPLKELYTDQNATIPLEFDEAQIRDDIDEAKKYKADSFTRNKVIFNDKDVIRVANNPGSKMGANNIRFSVGEKSSKIKEAIGKVIGEGQVQSAFDTAKFLAKNLKESTKNLNQLVRDYKDVMPSLEVFYTKLLALDKARNELLLRVEGVAVAAREMSDERLAVVNKFIADSTFYKKWGYDPEIDGLNVKVDPVMESRFNQLSEGEQEVVKTIFSHGEEMRAIKRKLAKQIGAPNLFPQRTMDGPYAPLKRYGDYVVVLESDALIQAQKNAANRPNSKIARDKVEELKANPDHYVVKFFDTMGAAQQFHRANKDKFPNSREAQERNKSRDLELISNSQTFNTILGRIAAVDGVSPAAKDAFEKLVRDMYFMAMDENDARQHNQRRMNRAGFDENMIRSFLSHAHSEASMISHMEYGAEVNEALAEANAEADASRKEKPRAIYNMVERHYVSALTPRRGWYYDLQSRANAITTFYMLTTSLGYHITNATQPGMVTLPMLSGRFGYAKSLSALSKGYQAAQHYVSFDSKNMQVVIDLEKAYPKSGFQKYHNVLKELQLRQLLDVGMEQDLNEFNEFDSGIDAINKVGKESSKYAHRFYQAARMVEAYNRISSGVAAYDLAMRNPQKLKKLNMTPTQYAVYVVESTQGNFSRLDAPLLLKEAPPVTVQYRKHQFAMAWFYANALDEAYNGASKEERAIAKKTFGIAVTQAGVLAGATGLPGIGLIMFFWNLVGDDDEPDDDLERAIRMKFKDNPLLADVLSRGVLGSLGVDMSAKLSQANIYSVAPYIDFDEKAPLEAVSAFIAGPSGSVVSNFAKSKTYFDKGDDWRGFEQLMPKGVKSISEAVRYKVEGFKLNNGDVIIDPTEFDIVDLVSTAAGIPASKVSKLKFTRGQQYELEQYFNEKSSNLRQRYQRAWNSNDKDEMRAVEKEFDKLQDAKDNVRPFFKDDFKALKRQTVIDLNRSIFGQFRREQKSRSRLRDD